MRGFDGARPATKILSAVPARSCARACRRSHRGLSYLSEHHSKPLFASTALFLHICDCVPFATVRLRVGRAYTKKVFKKTKCGE